MRWSCRCSGTSDCLNVGSLPYRQRSVFSNEEVSLTRGSRMPSLSWVVALRDSGFLVPEASFGISRTLQINSSGRYRIDKETDNVVESGFNGLGIWHGNERKEKLSTLHGIWLWDHPRASPSGRPTLYVNLEIEGLILPRTLYKFKHNTRGRREGQRRSRPLRYGTGLGLPAPAVRLLTVQACISWLPRRLFCLVKYSHGL